VSVPASVALIMIACLAAALFRFGLASLFVAMAGGLGLTAGLLLSVFTTYGIAPPLACALCGLGAGFLGIPVMQFRSVSKEAPIEAGDDDDIARRALSGLLASLLKSVAVLAVATVIISLAALNLDLEHLDVTSLTLISIVAIIGATIVALSIRSWPEKT